MKREIVTTSYPKEINDMLSECGVARHYQEMYFNGTFSTERYMKIINSHLEKRLKLKEKGINHHDCLSTI